MRILYGLLNKSEFKVKIVAFYRLTANFIDNLTKLKYFYLKFKYLLTLIDLFVII